MKIETQPLENHQVKLVVEVEPEKLEKAKAQAGRQIAKQVKIPGFRPGKAPYAMVLRQVGEAAILEEATEILVNDIYPKAVEEAKVEPYGPGSLENIVSLDPPRFEFVIPLKAEVELGDYLSVRLPYELKTITDEDVERVITDLRERQAVQEPVQRPAQEGDVVYIRLNGQRKEAESGQDPALVKDRSLPVVIEPEGVETQDEWPFPGFSRQLIGLSAGDENTIAHTFAQDSAFESLRGVATEFQAIVEDVKSRTLPELNDEFAQGLGEYTNLEDLRAKIKEDLQHHEQEAYDEDYEQRVLDQVTQDAEVKYSPPMLEREIDNVIESLKERLAQQKQDIDLYLKTRGMVMQGLREEVRPVAEERLKKTLVLLELSEAEKIQVDPEEVQSETTRTMEMMSRMLPEKEARRLSDRETVSNLVGNIMMDMVTHKTLDRIRAVASGQAETVVSEEAGSEPEPANEEKDTETGDRSRPAEPKDLTEVTTEIQHGEVDVTSKPDESNQVN